MTPSAAAWFSLSAAEFKERVSVILVTVAKGTLAAIATSRGICLAPTMQLKLTKVRKGGNNILAVTRADIYARRGRRK